MNIWQVLALEPTDDKKTIKRAYAKKLKACRPDQDPEAFQQLHEAYKAALEWRDHAVEAPQECTPSDTSHEALAERQHAAYAEPLVQPESQPFESGSQSLELESPEPPIQSDPYADTQALDHSQSGSTLSVVEPVIDEQKGDVYSVFDRNIDGLINDEARFFRIKLWRKLLESEDAEEVLADLSYKLTVSTWVFGWVLYKQSQDAPLSRHLLRYFAGFFQWQSYQKRLDERFGYGIVGQMLEYIDQTAVAVTQAQPVTAKQPMAEAVAEPEAFYGDRVSEHYQIAGLFSRMQAALVDLANAWVITFVAMFVVVFLAITFVELSGGGRSLLIGLVTIATFLGRYSWLAASNPSPGQRRAGLAMIDGSGQWANKSRLRLRAIVLSLGVPLLVLSLPANILCYVLTRRYVHDVVSGVSVIDLSRPIHTNTSPFDT